MNIIRGNNTITRTVRLAFFILPIVYVAGILGTTIHEVLGHGLSAVILGGQFSGFIVKWDAMGGAFASIPAGAPVTYHILHLASGIIATTLCGVILWGLVFFFRRRPDIQLALLVGSFILLIDGIDYIVWNAYHPSPPMGDVGKIILFYQVMEFPGFTVIQWIFLITGVLLFAGTIFYFCTSIFVRIEALILSGGQFTGKSRLLALFLFLALPGAYEFLSFDWNQIAPGIGRLPNVVGALSVITVAGLLFWYRPRLKNVNTFPLITWRHMTVPGTCLLVTITSLALWLNEGVRWEVTERHKAPRIIGPTAINGSGDLLVCGVEKDGVRRRYIIPLTHDDFEPIVLEFPGSDKSLGTAWRPSVEHDELLFITAAEEIQIKRFRISGDDISEISSYPVDPNLLVAIPVWNPSGSILALRVNQLMNETYDGSFLGFSKDNGKTIHISQVPATVNRLWVDDHRLYAIYSEDGNKVLSEVRLDVENMTCEIKDVLRAEDIYLARGRSDGSIIYASGSKIFRNNTLLCQLPEDITGLLTDDGFVVCLSDGGQRIYVLNREGQIIDTIQIPERSSLLLDMSAEHECLYLWARDRSLIYRYNFVEKSESVVFEAADKPEEAPSVTPSTREGSSRE
ncbi:hypothetical protein ACFL3Q_02815 [Planctomycetota bacterium]